MRASLKLVIDYYLKPRHGFVNTEKQELLLVFGINEQLSTPAQGQLHYFSI